MNGLNTEMVYSSERQIFDIHTREIMYKHLPLTKRAFTVGVCPKSYVSWSVLFFWKGPHLMEQSKNTVRPGKMWSRGLTDVIQ